MGRRCCSRRNKTSLQVAWKGNREFFMHACMCVCVCVLLCACVFVCVLVWKIDTVWSSKNMPKKSGGIPTAKSTGLPDQR